METLVSRVQAALGNDVTVKAQEVCKNGVKKMGITIRKGNEKLSPIIYINPEHSDDENFERVIKIHNDFVLGALKQPELPPITKEFILDNLSVRVVSLEKNQHEFAEKGVPYRQIAGDLVAVPQVVLRCDENGIQSFIVNPSVIEITELTADEIIDKAIENMQGTAIIRDMFSLLSSFDAELLDDIDVEPSPMFVMSNKYGVNGAGTLVDYTTLDKLSTKLGCDLLVFPSSVHELIIVPAKELDATPEDLSNMIKDINSTQLREEDVLSNVSYMYDSKARAIFENS